MMPAALPWKVQTRWLNVANWPSIKCA